MPSKTGALLVLAWPETKVFNAGAWYDGLMQLVGVSKKGYYNVGHAAIVLLDYSSVEPLYYDFGRYHTPIGKGRVRSKRTDPDVSLTTELKWRDGTLSNIDELLLELSSKKATHGTGKLVASYFKDVDLQGALIEAERLQGLEAMPYGPFVVDGTNCSRFVSSLIRASLSSGLKKIMFHAPYVISASPISNVKMANSYQSYFVVEKGVITRRPSRISRLYNPRAIKK